MSIILDVFPDTVISRSNSTITNFSQKRTLNLPNACFVCSPTQETCSHRNRGCPEHPTALLVQDFNRYDYLCSVCGCTLPSDIDTVINKRHKTQYASDGSQHNVSYNSTSIPTNGTLLKQHQESSTTQNIVSPAKKTITPTTTTAVATEPDKKTIAQESTMVQHVEQDSSPSPPPPQLTKTGKPKKKSTQKKKKAALLMKQQLVTGQCDAPVKNAASDPSQQESIINSKSSSPTDPLVKIKDEPMDPDDISVMATTMGSNNIPALAPWPYKMEHIDSGHTSTSTPTTAATINASKKKMTYSGTKSVLNGIAKMEQLANDINAPMSLVQNASALFRKVYESGLLRNRPVDIIVSTCLYITCRQEGVPRTFQEIAQISKVSKKELGRSFKIILKLLDTPVDVITTKDFMCRFCHALGLGGELMEAAQYIATEAAKLDLVAGRSPVSVAAAAIYVATQASSEPRSAGDIGLASGVSEATIFSVYRSIYPHARELFPANFRFHTSIENLPTQRVAFS